MINLVFDPKVLTLSVEKNEYSDVIGSFFDKAISTTEEKIYYLLPGVIALFQWLHSLDNVKISLFSSESQRVNPAILSMDTAKIKNIREKILQIDRSQRTEEEEQALISAIIAAENKLFFSELLKSINQPRKEIKLFSEENLNKNGQGIRTSFNCCNRNGYKDLSVVHAPSEAVTSPGEVNNFSPNLSNTILIDKDIISVLKGQEKYFLCTPDTSLESYKYSKINKYNSSGYKPLSCLLSKNKKDCIREIQKVKNGNSILIILEKEYLHLCFLNNDSYETKVIFKKDNLELFNELSAQKFDLYKSTLFLTNESLKNKIYEQVSSFGGKTTKICLRVNRIAFLAGILSHAIYEFEKNQTPISETIFKLQHEEYTSSNLKGVTECYYKQKFDEVARNETFYRKGLELLQQEDPDLGFSTPFIQR